MDLIAATGLVILLKLDSNRFSVHMTLKFNGWPWKTIRRLFYSTSSCVHYYKSISEFKLEVQSGNSQFGSKLVIFVPCNLEMWWMAMENKKAPLLYASSFVHHFKAIGGFNLVDSGKSSIWVKIGDIVVPCDLEIWWMTLKIIGHLFYTTLSFVHISKPSVH